MGRILIIDDEEQIRGMLSAALERAGYTVVEAINGKDGLRKYREAPADLVITDIIMPDQEGLETIKTLRKEYPQAKIFTISGADEVLKMNVLDVAQRLGSLRSFKKPFDLNEVVAAVREVVPLKPTSPA